MNRRHLDRVVGGSASHLLATDPLSSPVLHRLLRDETAVSIRSLRAASPTRQYSDGRALNSTVSSRGRRPQAPAQRRWPSGNPRLSAFCRSAPTVPSWLSKSFLPATCFESVPSALAHLPLTRCGV